MAQHFEFAFPVWWINLSKMLEKCPQASGLLFLALQDRILYNVMNLLMFHIEMDTCNI